MKALAPRLSILDLDGSDGSDDSNGSDDKKLGDLLHVVVVLGSVSI